MRRPEVGILALAMLASACAFPTESPNWDMTWNLPMPDNNGMSIGVTDLLPTGVTLAGTPPNAFSITPGSITPIVRTLGAQCPTCPSATAPKPAFTAPAATTTISLQAGSSLDSATISTGSQLVLTLTNGFGFDPINPPGGSPGTITLAIVNGTSTLGTLTLQGGSQTIPSGQTKSFTVALAGKIRTSSPITVTMTMDSPAGSVSQPVTMSPAQTFSVATAATINVSSASVTIGAQVIDAAPPTPLDLSQIDSSVVNRIIDDNQVRGMLFLTVTNPFTIGATPNVVFQSPAATPLAQKITPITKSITIPPAPSVSTPVVAKLSVGLTGHELRSLFGRDIEAVFSGTTGAGKVTVTPLQQITITSRIQVNFSVREQKP